MSSNRMLALRGACLVIGLACSASLSAAMVEDAWSGQLIPSGDNDPWLLGTLGAPFDLLVNVSSSEPDSAALNVEYALFSVSAASLTVGGQVADYLGNGVLDFTDDDSVFEFDNFVFGGRFDLAGAAVDIDSLVAFAMSTFTFTQLSEAPPQLPATSQVLRSIAARTPYNSVVAANSLVLVTVVPEPASLIAAALVAGACFRLRRRG